MAGRGRNSSIAKFFDKVKKGQDMSSFEIASMLSQIYNSIEGNNSILTDIQAQCTDLKAQCTDLKAQCSELKAQNSELLNRNKVLEDKVQQLESRILKLEEEKNKKDFFEVKNDIIIAGVPFHDGAMDDHETSVQTQEVVGSIMKDIGFTAQHKAFRFKRGEDPKKIPNLCVQFSSAQDKKSFFQRLAANKKKSNNKFVINARISDRVPAYLKESYQLAQKAAYLHRQGGKCKTKVILNFNGVILSIKPEGEEKYREVEFENGDDDDNSLD